MGGAFFLIMKFHYGYDTDKAPETEAVSEHCFFSNVNDDLFLAYNID